MCDHLSRLTAKQFPSIVPFAYLWSKSSVVGYLIFLITNDLFSRIPYALNGSFNPYVTTNKELHIRTMEIQCCQRMWRFYNEICSFCLYRCRRLNRKIKNLQSIRESLRFNFRCKLVTKTFKHLASANERSGLYFLFFAAKPLLEKIITVELPCAILSHKLQSIQNLYYHLLRS